MLESSLFDDVVRYSNLTLDSVEDHFAIVYFSYNDANEGVRIGNTTKPTTNLTHLCEGSCSYLAVFILGSLWLMVSV